MSVHLGRSIKIHLYWAFMVRILQQMALNIPNQTTQPLQVIAHYCRVQSCSDYQQEALLRCIKATYVFKNANS